MDRAKGKSLINTRIARFAGVPICDRCASMCDRCSNLVHFPHLFRYDQAGRFTCSEAERLKG